MKAIIHGVEYECAKAIKGNDFVELFDASCRKIASFNGISDFGGYALDGGDWTEPIPSTESVLLELAADHEARLCEIELGV